MVSRVIIAAITSKANIKARLPAHYYFQPGNGLALPSLVLLEHIRTADKRRQGIRIAYDLIGFIPPEALTKEETA